MAGEKTFFKEGTDSPWYCEPGVPHELTYRGKDSGEYMCRKCGIFIKKDTLKKLTD